MQEIAIYLNQSTKEGQSVNQGTTPEIFKTSHTTPIFKKGDQGVPENYQPVAMTLIRTKIFEKGNGQTPNPSGGVRREIAELQQSTS